MGVLHSESNDEVYSRKLNNDMNVIYSKHN